MSTIALAFVAGVSGSVGPCAAPRYLAIAGLAGRSSTRARLQTLVAFTIGTVCVSVLVVESSAIVVAALQWSTALYAALSAAFLFAGAWSLVVRASAPCSHDASGVTSHGVAFSLGAACALVPSACCTPFLLGIGTLGSNETLSANALAAAAFALGHLSVLGFVVVGSAPLMRFASCAPAHDAARTVGAGLSLALAAYYAVLA